LRDHRIDRFRDRPARIQGDGDDAVGHVHWRLNNFQ
jgi:hypothetical protein